MPRATTIVLPSHRHDLALDARPVPPRHWCWLWQHLRDAFPQAIAVVLMPDHPHVLLATAEPDEARTRLARLLGQFGRAFGFEGRCSNVPAPSAVRERKVLARNIRYIALNPCRAGLVDCPLAWMWSTHRDVVGASVDPWVSAERLAIAMQCSPRDFAARHHAYVSGDPDAHVGGTPMPTAVVTSKVPHVPLQAIAEAAAAAMRRPLDAIRTRGPTRALCVALAVDQGWTLPQRLADLCACSTRTIANLAHDVDPAAISAARLCLGDTRFTRPERRESSNAA